MDYDLHNNVDDRVALDAQAITTNTTTVGNIIDTKGFNSIVFAILSKVITDGAYALKVEDGEDSGLSDAADVPAADVLGALTGFVAADDNVVKRIGVVSKKRYVRLSIVSTGVTAGVDIMSAVAILGHPLRAPVAQ